MKLIMIARLFVFAAVFAGSFSALSMESPSERAELEPYIQSYHSSRNYFVPPQNLSAERLKELYDIHNIRSPLSQAALGGEGYVLNMGFEYANGETDTLNAFSAERLSEMGMLQKSAMTPVRWQNMPDMMREYLRDKNAAFVLSLRFLRNNTRPEALNLGPLFERNAEIDRRFGILNAIWEIQTKREATLFQAVEALPPTLISDFHRDILRHEIRQRSFNWDTLLDMDFGRIHPSLLQAYLLHELLFNFEYNMDSKIKILEEQGVPAFIIESQREIVDTLQHIVLKLTLFAGEARKTMGFDLEQPVQQAKTLSRNAKKRNKQRQKAKEGRVAAAAAPVEPVFEKIDEKENPGVGPVGSAVTRPAPKAALQQVASKPQRLAYPTPQILREALAGWKGKSRDVYDAVYSTDSSDYDRQFTAKQIVDAHEELAKRLTELGVMLAQAGIAEMRAHIHRAHNKKGGHALLARDVVILRSFPILYHMEHPACTQRTHGGNDHAFNMRTQRGADQKQQQAIARILDEGKG